MAYLRLNDIFLPAICMVTGHYNLKDLVVENEGCMISGINNKEVISSILRLCTRHLKNIGISVSNLKFFIER